MCFFVGDGVGDICQKDFDNDNTINSEDACPFDSKIQQTDFRNYEMVNLDPVGISQHDPEWIIKNDGAEIEQILNSDPGLAIGEYRS